MANSYGPRELSQEEIDLKLKAFDDIPLFMKSLPDDESENPAIAALQDLVYEGTPDEIAANFKDQGNDYFKGKRYREALGFYTQGIDVKPTDKNLLTALLCNRAACNLELQNYGSVLRDCSTVLKQDDKVSKAYYRSAQALISLDRVEEALDCCDRCLTFDPDNQGIKAVRERAAKRKDTKDEQEHVRQERLRKEREEKLAMQAAFRERNLVDIPKPDGSSNPYQPHFDPEDLSKKILVLPVFFLYPQYAISDVIQEFCEETTFEAHLEEMFPPKGTAPPWDSRGEYTYKNLVVYAMTHRKRLFKVGKKMTLRDVFGVAKGKEGEPRDGLEVKDGCITFVVIPKGDEEKKWVEEFKKSREE
ncbi:hypothetical protein EST38_g77 [Candolleomyces aberdarensis]|uniref:Cns1/TTC4 wheel domain-containing protein n=1 Tax=Candolleomyces aberdarensis TaxID=2316362 RepID=A0A4Q2E103_9AGAR|nr:hypothetical protein EST38_g77 [Candolleomyces aberdarensis]